LAGKLVFVWAIGRPAGVIAATTGTVRLGVGALGWYGVVDTVFGCAPVYSFGVAIAMKMSVSRVGGLGCDCTYRYPPR